MSAQSAQKTTVALAGNPNVGKSTLFNSLTGLRQHTGNWPGKTVGIASGSLQKEGTEYVFIDLPGTYSLSGSSEDERVASEYLASGAADCTVVVCDGSCLQRSLILALQILEQVDNAVVCVNLMDEAEKNGIKVNAAALSEHLDAPVVLTAAGEKGTLIELLDQIDQVALEKKPCNRQFGDAVTAAERIVNDCVTVVETGRIGKQIRVDRLLVSRWLGIPLMLLLLFLIIWLTVWGANYPSALLEKIANSGYSLLRVVFCGLPDWLFGILIDGAYVTAARVICVMLPPMAIFFPLFTILEDIGYLPRMAFLLDGTMRKCGGCGKQALTMCMGLGCNAVGVMGCRIIDSPRERLQAVLTNAMIPCNGRFPTLIVLGSLFGFGAVAAFGVAGCIILGVLGVMAASGILSKTFLRHEQSVFTMEMPPFRKPRVGQILVRSLLDRTLHISVRALKVAAPAGAMLWILANTGTLRMCAEFLDPMGIVMGMNGMILLAFVFSLPANELFLPVLLLQLSGAGSLQGVAGLDNALLFSMDWTWIMAVCTMVFAVFHWPCVTTLMTVYKETGSIKETAAAFILPTAVGTVLCMILNLLSLF